MNETQTVFALFFAIFWGAVANVQPRWKAFQLPMVHFPRVRTRVLLSFLFLNLLPLVFFGYTLWMLQGPATSNMEWTVWKSAKLILRGVIPAFAIFGFYHLWIGIVERKSTVFYYQNQDAIPDARYRKQPGSTHIPEPTIDDLNITPHAWWANIAVGAGFVILALLMPLVFR